jgi:hypothetical protein
VAGLMARHGVTAAVRPEGYQWMPDYHQRLTQS